MISLVVTLLFLLHVDYSAGHSNEYKFFDMVRQWTPNTCYLSSHKCKHLIPQIKDVWTIHGLWPSLDAKHYPADCAGSTCHFNTSSIADLLPMMHVEWPTDYSGGDTKFWNHEYCKHGTCCTDVLPTQHDFFSKALELHHLYNVEQALAVAGIVPDLHVTYTMEQLRQAVETSFGVKEAVFWCRSVKDNGISKQLLFQISICFTKGFDVMDCPKVKPPLCAEDKPFYLLPYSILNSTEN